MKIIKYILFALNNVMKFMSIGLDLARLLIGFEAAGVACCATGMFEMGYACDQYNPLTCKDANKFVFWDAFHPTEKTNQIIVDHLMKTSLHKFL